MAKKAPTPKPAAAKPASSSSAAPKKSAAPKEAKPTATKPTTKPNTKPTTKPTTVKLAKANATKVPKYGQGGKVGEARSQGGPTTIKSRGTGPDEVTKPD